MIFRKFIFILFGYALIAPTLASAITAPQAPVADSAAVLRTVRAIIGYTKWPKPNEKRTICLLGSSSHGTRLNEVSSNAHLRKLNITDKNFGGCDILYLGRLNVNAMQAATQAVANQPVLTFHEVSKTCASRAMVCLKTRQSKIDFSLNLDSIARSGLRIDPRILRLSKTGI